MMEYYSTMKKNEILPFVTTWMHLESIVLNECQRQIPFYFTHMWNLKTKDKKAKLIDAEISSSYQRKAGQGEGRIGEMSQGVNCMVMDGN